MIELTRLDGSPIYLNERNIQWVEVLPDVTITFLGGARVIVKEKLPEVQKAIEDAYNKSSVSDFNQ